MTQNDMLMEALQKGETITPLSAFIRIHSLRLAARVKELEQQGVPIIHEWMKVGTKRVMSYRLGKIAHG